MFILIFISLLLTPQSDSPETNKRLEPPRQLLEAAERGDVRKVTKFSQDPAWANQDENGRTALTAAGEKHQKAAFAALVAIADERSKTEASKVARQGQPAVADAMAAVQARMELFNTPNKDGMTPLTFAAAQGWDDLCRALIEGGARTDILDKKVRSAADHAQAAGFTALAQTLRNVQKN